MNKNRVMFVGAKKSIFSVYTMELRYVDGMSTIEEKSSMREGPTLTIKQRSLTFALTSS